MLVANKVLKGAKTDLKRAIVGSPAKGNTVCSQACLNAYRRMLSGSKIDARTALYRVLREKEQELITALGGDPSPQEKLIIADTVKTLLFIGTVDEYLMSLDGGIIKGGKVVPVVESRTSLASHYAGTWKH